MSRGLMADSDITDAFEILKETIEFVKNQWDCRAKQMLLGHLNELMLQFEHHALGSSCLSLNIDHVEVRPPEYDLVAIVENKVRMALPTQFEFQKQGRLANLANLPYYIVNSLGFKGPKVVNRITPLPMMSAVLTWDDYVKFQTNLPNDDILSIIGKPIVNVMFGDNKLQMIYHRQVSEEIEKYLEHPSVWK